MQLATFAAACVVFAAALIVVRFLPARAQTDAPRETNRQGSGELTRRY
jgi:hypothetical protein